MLRDNWIRRIREQRYLLLTIILLLTYFLLWPLASLFNWLKPVISTLLFLSYYLLAMISYANKYIGEEKARFLVDNFILSFLVVIIVTLIAISLSIIDSKCFLLHGAIATIWLLILIGKRPRNFDMVDNLLTKEAIHILLSGVILVALIYCITRFMAHYKYLTPDEAMYLLYAISFIENRKTFPPAVSFILGTSFAIFFWSRWLWIILISSSFLLFGTPFAVNFIAIYMIWLGLHGLFAKLFRSVSHYLRIILSVPIIMNPIILTLSYYLLPDLSFAGFALLSVYYFMASFIEETKNDKNVIKVNDRVFTLSLIMTILSMLIKFNLLLPVMIISTSLIIWIRKRKNLEDCAFSSFNAFILFLVILYELLIDIPYSLWLVGIAPVLEKYVRFAARYAMVGTPFRLVLELLIRFSKSPIVVLSFSPSLLITLFHFMIFFFVIYLQPSVFLFVTVGAILFLVSPIISHKSSADLKMYTTLMRVMIIIGSLIGCLYHWGTGLWPDMDRNLLILFLLIYSAGIFWIYNYTTEFIEREVKRSYLTLDLPFISVSIILFVLAVFSNRYYAGDLYIFGMAHKVSHLPFLLMGIVMFYLLLSYARRVRRGHDPLPRITRVFSRALRFLSRFNIRIGSIAIFLLISILILSLNNAIVFNRVLASSYYISSKDVYGLHDTEKFLNFNVTNWELVVTNIYELMAQSSGKIVLSYPLNLEDAEILLSMNASISFIYHDNPIIGWLAYRYGIVEKVIEPLNNYLSNITEPLRLNDFVTIYRINGSKITYPISTLTPKIGVSLRMYNLTNAELTIYGTENLPQNTLLYIIVNTPIFSRIFKVKSDLKPIRIVFERVVSFDPQIDIAISSLIARYCNIIILDDNLTLLYLGTHSLYSFSDTLLLFALIPIFLLFVTLQEGVSPANIVKKNEIAKLAEQFLSELKIIR